MKIPLLLLLAALSAPVVVTAQTSLSIGSTPGYQGVSYALPVTLSRATNIVAAQFDVAFDPAKVSAAAALPDLTSVDQMVLSRELSPGLRRVLVFSRNNAVITNRTIAQTPFTVSAAERVSSGPLTPTHAVVAQTDAAALTSLSLNAGTIFVRPVNLLPNGHVQFFLPSTPDTRYAIQATTNLVNWVNISTNTATGNFMDLVDV